MSTDRFKLNCAESTTRVQVNWNCGWGRRGCIWFSSPIPSELHSRELTEGNGGGKSWRVVISLCCLQSVTKNRQKWQTTSPPHNPCHSNVYRTSWKTWIQFIKLFWKGDHFFQFSNIRFIHPFNVETMGFCSTLSAKNFREYFITSGHYLECLFQRGIIAWHPSLKRFTNLKLNFNT